MKSPIDPSVGLKFETLPDGPGAYRCPTSGGVWIRAIDYQKWLGRPSDASTSTIDDPGEDLPRYDSPAGKRCPEDGKFLIRHKVGRGLPFHVDRCGGCACVWLDKGEWDALRGRDLHEKLTRVFTSAWQAQVRRAAAQKARVDALRDRMGDADFEKLEAFRKWLNDHPEREMLLARLGEVSETPSSRCPLRCESTIRAVRIAI